jgi:tRNA pseudouridine55 synthase
MIQKDGIIIVDKDSGPSSFKVVEGIRSLMKAKKAGHAGTLDPFASGVLVVLLNQGTKLCPFLMSHDKVYRAALRLGIETDTQDLTGQIIKVRDIGVLPKDSIKEKARRFVGMIRQVPPVFSAIHHKGRRAYELARSGVAVDLQEREVRIEYINVLRVDLPTIWIEVCCSSGTYIRTLAADLGRSLGTGAHLTFLRRVQSGPFHVDDAFTVTQAGRYVFDNRVDEVVIPLKQALKGMMEVEISDALARRIRNGHKPHREELCGQNPSSLNSGDSLKAVVGEELVAVLGEDSDGYSVKRVFI